MKNDLDTRYPAEVMCTLTPAQIIDNIDIVKAMYQAGMRSVRLNTAHLTGIEMLQSLAGRLKAVLPNIKILIDTKGPEMRTTAMENDSPVAISPGDKVCIMGTDTDLKSSASTIYVNYPLIHTVLRPGVVILIDDGRIVMEVDSANDTSAIATVRQGDLLGSRKGFAVKDVDVDLPAVSDHDRMYIAYAAKSPDIDIVAHSFVRSADDVLAVKAAMGNATKPVIAKIENRQGIDNLADIIAVADGILIARGDLTASIGVAGIPAAQAAIAAAAKKAGKRLYLATNILSSMMHSSIPFIVDIEGIRLAVRQGVDVMLLTNETATGDYPVECVRTLMRYER